jgi:hypothetical protein
MPDLEHELARYGAVIRDRAPAVGLEEVKTRLARPPAGHRPVRSAVAGALVALASIGLMFVSGLLVDLLGMAPTGRTPSAAAAGGTSTGPAVMAIVVGSGALAVLGGAATVALRHHRKAQEPVRIAKTRERRKKKMRTIERPVAPVEKLERSNRYLIIGLVVAVLLAAGFGAWLIVDAVGTSTERQITALLDDYGAAWSANDGAGVLALLTEDGAVLAGNGRTYRSDELAFEVDHLGEFSVEPVSDLAIYERVTGWYVATADEHGMELFNIVEQDGTMLIRFHETWRGGS